jgi:hypothetical protein
MRSIAFGEHTASGISKGNPVKGGDCIWCDEPVWLSSIGYLTEKPEQNVDVKNHKAYKAVHKLCFADILKTGQEVMIALEANMRKRGLLP